VGVEVVVEPSLGDAALFLLNRPTFTMVLPGGPHPWTAELTPGWVEDTAELREAAIEAADAAERAQMLAVIEGLAPPCALPQELTVGYEVHLEELDGACLITVEPDPEQHRRRFRYPLLGGVPEAGSADDDPVVVP